MWVGLGSWWRRTATGRACRSWRLQRRPPPRRPSAAANCFGGDGGGGGPTDRPSGSDWAWCPSRSRRNWAAGCPCRRLEASAEVATGRWRAFRPIGAAAAVGGSSSFRPDVVAAAAGADAVPCRNSTAGSLRRCRRRHTPDWASRLPIRTATFAASMRNCWRWVRRRLRPVAPPSSFSCTCSSGSGTKFSPVGIQDGYALVVWRMCHNISWPLTPEELFLFSVGEFLFILNSKFWAVSYASYTQVSAHGQLLHPREARINPSHSGFLLFHFIIILLFSSFRFGNKKETKKKRVALQEKQTRSIWTRPRRWWDFCAIGRLMDDGSSSFFFGTKFLCVCAREKPQKFPNRKGLPNSGPFDICSSLNLHFKSIRRNIQKDWKKKAAIRFFFCFLGGERKRKTLGRFMCLWTTRPFLFFFPVTPIHHAGTESVCRGVRHSPSWHIVNLSLCFHIYTYSLLLLY